MTLVGGFFDLRHGRIYIAHCAALHLCYGVDFRVWFSCSTLTTNATLIYTYNIHGLMWHSSLFHSREKKAPYLNYKTETCSMQLVCLEGPLLETKVCSTAVSIS